jgi:hypothetical protein
MRTVLIKLRVAFKKSAIAPVEPLPSAIEAKVTSGKRKRDTAVVVADKTCFITYLNIMLIPYIIYHFSSNCKIFS